MLGRQHPFFFAHLGCRAICLVLLWAIGSSFSLAAESPEEALDEYLSSLIDDSLELKDTAISPFCPPAKKGAIADRVNALRELLLDGNLIPGDEGKMTRYQIMEVKVQDDLGVGLISYQRRSRPFSIQIQSLGLVKDEGEWLVAPMPGSFNDTLIGFDSDRKAAAEELLRWADGAINERGATIAAEGAENLKKSLRAVEAKLPKKEASPFEVLSSFREAMQSGDLILAMAHCLDSSKLLESELIPEGFEKAYLYLDISMTSEKATPLWNYLVQSGAVISEAETDEMKNEAELSVFHRDFREQTRFQVNYDFRKHDGRWLLVIPSALQEGGERSRWQMAEEQSEMIDEYGYSCLEAALLKQRDLVDFDSPEALAKRCQEILTARNFEDLIFLLERVNPQVVKENLSWPGDPMCLSLLSDVTSYENAVYEPAFADTVDRLALSWRRAELGSTLKVLSVHLAKSETVATWYWAAIDTTKIEKLTVQSMNFVKNGDRWMVETDFTGDSLEKRRADLAKLSRPLKELRKTAEKMALKEVAERASFVNFVADGATDQSNVKTLRKAWSEMLAKLKSSKIEDLHEDCGLLAGSLEKNPEQALSDMGNVLRGLKMDAPNFKSVEVGVDGVVGVVSASVVLGKENSRSPFYVFVHEGGRWLLVPQFQLEVPSNLGRRLLNRRIFGEMKEILGEERFAKIEKMFLAHCERLPVEEFAAP